MDSSVMQQITAELPVLSEVLKSILIVATGWLCATLCVRLITPALRIRLGVQNRQMIERLIFWLILGLFIASALKQLGFELSVLLGAAGILTVALGFASQTSAANIISGLFIMGERSISVGDLISVADKTGEVLSIDWLSVKLRTFDNLYVRIPNEQIIKAEVTNLSRFPIRRIDMSIGIAYKEDIGVVRSLLMQVADRNPLCLEHPAPMTILKGFGESSIDIQLSVWGMRENYLELKNSIIEEIKQSFDLAGIEIPFPQRTLHLYNQSHPVTVQIRDSAEKPG